jgi:hypothetical protein
MENLPTGEISRLVLLPVDPYLMHVYWDLDSTAPPAAGVRPILRFHESGDSFRNRPFDVEVDLAASNCYVHLWSPNKTYYADIGWQASDGSFTPLARSNTVSTPPAWVSPSVSAPVSAPVTLVERPILPKPIVEQSMLLKPHVGRPIQAPAPVQPAPAEHLQRKLAELYAIRRELPPVAEPVEPDVLEPEGPGEPSLLENLEPEPPAVELPEIDLPEIDLTEYAEERFTPGVSSARDPLGE